MCLKLFFNSRGVRVKRTVFVVKLLFFVSIFANSCATITRNSFEPVRFNSIPNSASVEVGSSYRCESTPCVITIPRTTTETIVFKKDGCKDKVTNTIHRATPDIAWMLAGNLLFLGPFGLVFGTMVDLASGATRDVFPNPVEVKLDCKNLSNYQQKKFSNY